MRLFMFLFFLSFCGFGYAQNQVPVISNFNATVNGGQVNITYDLSDTESNTCEVKLLLSSNGGQTYISKAGTISGDVGFPIAPGTGKQITWNFDTVSNVYVYSLRIVADDKQVPNIQDIVDAVDSNRLRSDLQFVQGIRHYTANPTHLEAVKDTIEYRFNEAGLNTYKQDFTKAGYLGQNVIGKKAGLGKEDTTYIIDAHFDSVNSGPGADDNGSGVVGFLEALHVLAPYNFTKTIRFIGFDFEETTAGSTTGSEGSLKYTQTGIPSWEKIQGVANFEMIGYYSEVPNSQQVPTGFNVLFANQYAVLQADSFRGNFLVNAGDGESAAFNTAFDTLSRRYVPALKLSSIIIPVNGTIAPDFLRSDHSWFWLSPLNMPALLLTDGANFRNHSYHTAGDTIGALNFTFMSNIVKATVATIATLAGIQHSSYSNFDLTPLSIPKSNLNCEVRLNPVPAKSTLYIQTGDCFDGGFTFRIMDIQGKELLKKTVTGNNTTDVLIDKLPSGIYFAVLQNDKGSVVQKFAKE